MTIPNLSEIEALQQENAMLKEWVKKTYEESCRAIHSASVANDRALRFKHENNALRRRYHAARKESAATLAELARTSCELAEANKRIQLLLFVLDVRQNMNCFLRDMMRFKNRQSHLLRQSATEKGL